MSMDASTDMDHAAKLEAKKEYEKPSVNEEGSVHTLGVGSP